MTSKRTAFAILLSVLTALPACAGGFDLKSQVDFYRQRYGLRHVDEKLIDNRGNGYENLYGVRNLRTVLHGVYYRGGANNKFNREQVRANDNPLQDKALERLCQEGFSESLYLYDKNYASARKQTNCRNPDNADQTLNYRQITAFDRQNEHALLTKVFNHIRGITPGPLYAHCWNGWHASGITAALSLRQFCDWSGAEAEAYWVRNTDGDSNYPSIKKRIRNFTPHADLRITAEEKALVCP